MHLIDIYLNKRVQMKCLDRRGMLVGRGMGKSSLIVAITFCMQHPVHALELDQFECSSYYYPSTESRVEESYGTIKVISNTSLHNKNTHL